MAEPTKTLQQLRRELCQSLEMPFFRRFNTSRTMDAGSSASLIKDSALVQSAKYWKGSWLYVVDGDAAGDVRLIVDFDDTSDGLVPEWDLSVAPASGDAYEIHSIWSAYDLHKAINDAIAQGWPAFFEIDYDETLVLKEDVREYSLTGITNLYRIMKVWLENPNETQTGTAQSATSNTIVVQSGADLSDVDDDWKISIYDGTGAGELQDVSSVNDSTDTVTIVSTWGTNPDSTSKYRLWNPEEQLYNWAELNAVEFDRKQWPSNLTMRERYASRFGCRLRIQYMHDEAVTLTAEADTTIVPPQFIMDRAKALLYTNHGAKIKDRDMLAVGRELMADSEQFKQDHAFNSPDATLWQKDDPRGTLGGELTDPLDWF